MKQFYIRCGQCGKQVKVDATGDFGFRLGVCDDCGADFAFEKAEIRELKVESSVA